jgi:hypothetical protein
MKWLFFLVAAIVFLVYRAILTQSKGTGDGTSRSLPTVRRDRVRGAIRRTMHAARQDLSRLRRGSTTTMPTPPVLPPPPVMELPPAPPVPPPEEVPEIEEPGEIEELPRLDELPEVEVLEERTSGELTPDEAAQEIEELLERRADVREELDLEEPEVEEIASPTPPATPADARAGPPLPVEEVAEALFAPGVTSSEADRRFEERYRGKPVAWSGRIQRVETYSRDDDFGEGPGVRAVLLVHEITGESWGGREVRAVLQLAPEHEELRARRGGTIAFRGRLVACDGFLRELRVADGALD